MAEWLAGTAWEVSTGWVACIGGFAATLLLLMRSGHWFACTRCSSLAWGYRLMRELRTSLAAVRTVEAIGIADSVGKTVLAVGTLVRVVHAVALVADTSP